MAPKTITEGAVPKIPQLKVNGGQLPKKPITTGSGGHKNKD
jgi:hypothetical protein